jgi:hypothetical protein
MWAVATCDVAADTTRVQVPLDSGSLERVKTLSEANRRSLGSMCAELIEYALSSDQYKQGREEDFKQEVIKAVMNGNPVHMNPRIQKVLKILALFENDNDSQV